MKNKKIILMSMLVAGCGDVDTEKLRPLELDVAVKKLSLCTDVTNETQALEITRYAESTIDRKHQFPCSSGSETWTPKLHEAMKTVGFRLVTFRTRNYKPNANQQRLEIIYNYEDNSGLKKTLSYSCEMTDKMKEWAAKSSAPQC